MRHAGKGFAYGLAPVGGMVGRGAGAGCGSGRHDPPLPRRSVSSSRNANRIGTPKVRQPLSTICVDGAMGSTRYGLTPDMVT